MPHKDERRAPAATSADPSASQTAYNPGADWTSVAERAYGARRGGPGTHISEHLVTMSWSPSPVRTGVDGGDAVARMKGSSMYPLPEAALETPQQMVELDDTFLTSDPFGYFVSRIAMIHTWAMAHEGTESAPDSGKAADTEDTGIPTALGRPDLNPTIEAVMRNSKAAAPGPTVVSAQVAVDAFALRHHVAEALARLFVACSERFIQQEPPTASLWSQMTDDKSFQVQQLVKAATKAGRDLPEEGFSQLVLPPDIQITSPEELAELQAFVHLCADWLEHATTLLEPAELDINTAHNKVKHGLAVRGRSDIKIAFTTVGPDEDGTLPLSAFDPDVSFDIFDSPMLEFMSRPKLPGQPRQGLEVTQLRLDYRALLAESALMALVHGALFHVAARLHFHDHAIRHGLSVAPHPGVVGAEASKPNLGGHQVGLRFPITNPPNGGDARTAGLGQRDGSFVPLDITGDRTSAQIVNDPPDADRESATTGEETDEDQ